MKEWFRNCTKSTIRLTLSYLAILVTVSLAYSVVMYTVTARELVLQLRSPNGTPQTIIGKNIPTAVLPEGTSGVHGKNSLRRNLIFLNMGVLALGAPFCYFLARRTLQPIEKAMDTQARFSSDAAHELRTPVAALRARNEVALRDPKLTLAKAREVIQSGADQAIRLEKLSEALLQLSRSDGVIVPKTAIHLEDVANEAMNLNVVSAQSKDITIADEVADVTVQANRQDIMQSVSILLDNAIKYSPRGSGIIIKSSKDHAFGRISVADEGQGIRATDIPRIFERFYRADHARGASDTHSYGLGLSIAQKLVAQNGGKLSVQSTLGQGSEFTITVPLAAH